MSCGVCIGSNYNQFDVNGVKITGKLTYVYHDDINPFTCDWLTAKTTSAAAMDSIPEAKATIAYYEGNGKEKLIGKRIQKRIRTAQLSPLKQAE